MLALQIIAAIFLFLSAALFFGPQLVIYGPRALPSLMKNPQARLAGGVFGSVAVMVALTPYMASALMQGGETVTAMALDIMTITFGLG